MSRELDQLIAEKVMGWTLRETTLYPMYYCNDEPAQYDDKMNPCASWSFKPSTDIGAAWLIVEKLSLDHMITIRTGGPRRPGGTYYHTETTVAIGGEYTRASKTPMAICLAALKLVGIEYTSPI